MRRKVDRMLHKEYKAAQHIADTLERTLKDERQYRLVLVGEKTGDVRAVETEKTDFKTISEALKTLEQLGELKKSLFGTMMGQGVEAVIEIPSIEES